ncbi:MAG: transporter related protein [Eubacterium sp.]|jgi:ribose transport system ATP-binding protein|nr:transporter related protein [Eubacterium sp.]
MGIPKLEVKNISRYFSDAFSLCNVSIDLYPGEVHAFMGENGSGKSTVIKIISGVLKQDSGVILIDNSAVNIDSVSSAKRHGIHCVWQDINLYPNLTVAENIYMDHPNTEKSFLARNQYRMFRECNDIFNEFGINIDTRAKAGQLGFAQKQLVEMVKAYVSNAQIVIFDEPSAAFTSNEKDILYRIIRALKVKNTAILYITHLLDEIELIADRFSVIHQGRVIGTQTVSNTSKDEIIRMLAVPAEKNRYPKLNITLGKVIMSVKDLSAADILSSISFELRKSEILGITGLMGSGRSLLAQCLFGITPVKTGTIEINGQKQKFSSPEDAIRNGIALLPEDRASSSIFGCLNLENNVTLSSLKRFEQYKYLHNQIMTDVTDTYIKKLSIRPGNLNDLLENYSGGNQQKAAVARWMMSRSKIYILDEPTRGVDIASKTDIYNCMLDLVSKGASIILISSDIEEILGMCDRVLVLAEGQISGEFRRSEATKEAIMYKATIKGNQ